MPCPEKFMETLIRLNVGSDVISLISQDYAGITSKAPKKTKAAYFKHATDVLTARLDADTLREIYEANACCKSGARLKTSKAFAKDNADASLEEKLARIPPVTNMGRPVLNADGTITVHAVSYLRDGKYRCACPNFNGLKYDYSVSRSYCFCCAGHFKFHYEIMLGIKLDTLEIVSSPLDSDGRNPCVIRFAIRK